jgi:predicted nuclease of predicted toxin-antitoxin system
VATFLLDENLSPRIARHLAQAHGFDAISILRIGQEGSSDTEIRALARRLRRVIVTLDRDFVDPLAYKYQTPPGILWINPPRSLRTIPGEIRLLDRFFELDASTLDLDHMIVELTVFTSIVHYSG